jgi:hypothetical protein
VRDPNEPGRPTPGTDDGHDPSTRHVEDRLRSLADEPLPTVVRDRHLHRLRTHVLDEVAPARRPRRAGSWRRRLAPLTAAATALVLFGGGGTVVAAQDALPDDALYGVKRASEQVWVGMPRGRERAADVRLAMAERRLGEARRAPHHAERLIAEGVADAEAAAEDRPEGAIEAFERLLGGGEGRLPEQASPRAREALHRNCTRIAEKHGLDGTRCGPAPDAGDHPGRGLGRDGAPGQGRDGAPGLGRDGAPGLGRDGAPGLGRDGTPGLGRDGTPGRAGDGPGHGWGPGGRPEGVEGPPHGRHDGRPDPDDLDDDLDDDVTGS